MLNDEVCREDFLHQIFVVLSRVYLNRPEDNPSIFAPVWLLQFKYTVHSIHSVQWTPLNNYNNIIIIYPELSPLVFDQIQYIKEEEMLLF